MKKYYFRQRGRNTHLVKGQSTRRRNEGPARFHFVKTDELNNNKKMYGDTYTERQLMLLNGEMSWETIRLNEITLLMRKAEQMNDTENYEKAKHLHQLKKNQDVFVSDMSTEDAIALLKSLNRRPDNT